VANVRPNITKGRVVELYLRVENNDPSTARFVWVLCSGSDTDAALADYDSLTAILAGPLNEITNTGYARVIQTDTETASTAPDDTNDRWDLDLPDPNFGPIQTGAVTASTRAILLYDPNAGGGDGAMLPCGIWDYATTFDTSNVIPTIDAAGFFRST
jgi:hypothetical protein